MTTVQPTRDTSCSGRPTRSIVAFIVVCFSPLAAPASITENALGKYPSASDLARAGWLEFLRDRHLYGVAWGFAPWYKWAGIVSVGGLSGLVVGSGMTGSAAPFEERVPGVGV